MEELLKELEERKEGHSAELKEKEREIGDRIEEVERLKKQIEGMPEKSKEEGEGAGA